MITNKYFLVLFNLVVFLSLILRLHNYDRIPPFAATQDEFMYPWAGMTFIQKGIPTSWSWFESYPKRDVVVFWGAQYPLVSPWLEKPPLYPLISGSFVLATGVDQMNQVRLSTIRLIPIALSIFTIILTGLLAKNFFGKTVGIISALLY